MLIRVQICWDFRRTHSSRDENRRNEDSESRRLLAQTEPSEAQFTSICASKRRQRFVKMSDTISDLDTQEACIHQSHASKTLISRWCKDFAQTLSFSHGLLCATDFKASWDATATGLNRFFNAFKSLCSFRTMSRVSKQHRVEIMLDIQWQSHLSWGWCARTDPVIRVWLMAQRGAKQEIPAKRVNSWKSQGTHEQPRPFLSSKCSVCHLHVNG